MAVPSLPGMRSEQWDGKTIGRWAGCLDGADAVLNLAGESIGGRRWTPAQKDRILRSRVDATIAVCEGIRQAGRKPATLVSASAVGIYGPVDQGDVPEDHPRGNTFLADVVDRWETAAREAEKSGVRVVLVRIGVVLGRGGALKRMMVPFRMFVGGPVGSGNQWFPWIHIDDLVNVLTMALKDAGLSGPINAVAPHTVTMREFSRELGRALHRPSWISLPGFVLRAALGEMAGMLLTGQKVIPSVLGKRGFDFKYPRLPEALADLAR